MRANELKSPWRRVAALAGAGALFFTVGCASREAGAVRAQEFTAGTAGQAGTPVLVSCEPGQRTLVRQTVVNGAPVSQVDCVTATGQTAYAQAPAVAQPTALPVSYGYAPQRVARPVYSDYGDAQVVPVTSAPARVARPVRTRQVVYDERPVKKQRSVKKSAIIIGSSAGAGAGVGAAVGGKKGALIGALIGGGGAAVWDQITRR
jgi:hypothetical protein